MGGWQLMQKVDEMELGLQNVLLIQGGEVAAATSVLIRSYRVGAPPTLYRKESKWRENFSENA